MRIPLESGNRLRRMASRHGWTASDASARLVEEGLRPAEYAFIDFRDSATGPSLHSGNTLAVREIILLLRNYQSDTSAVAKHLAWPEAKVRAAVHYGEAFPDETEAAFPKIPLSILQHSNARCRRPQGFLPPAQENLVMLKLLLDDTFRPKWHTDFAGVMARW